jgi:hypothetical protein
MERDTQATLHRRKLGRVDRMVAKGTIEELIRQFKSLRESAKSEYFIMVGARKYGPQEIEGLARELNI